MSVYFIDCETTSNKPPLEAIEIATLRVVPKEGEHPAMIGRQWQLEEWHSRFRPSLAISYGALAVHHILPPELADCPPSSSFKLPDDAEYIVGHSIDFDWEAIGSPPVKRICTLAMSRHVWPDTTGHSQSALIYMLRGMTPQTREILRNAHDARVDVGLNAFLLQHILNAVKEPILTWEELWRFSEDCRIPRTCPMRRYEGVLLEDLETSFIEWCLRLPDLDPYYRIGLERVIAKRYPQWNPVGESDPNDDLPF